MAIHFVAMPASLVSSLPKTRGGWSAEEARRFYLRQVSALPGLNGQWLRAGLSPQERLLLAYRLRHSARLTVRDSMADRAAVERLRQRDLDKYGHPDGPTLAQLIDKAFALGLSEEATADWLILGAQRTNKHANQKLNVAAPSPQLWDFEL